MIGESADSQIRLKSQVNLRLQVLCLSIRISVLGYIFDGGSDEFRLMGDSGGLPQLASLVKTHCSPLMGVFFFLCYFAEALVSTLTLASFVIVAFLLDDLLKHSLRVSILGG